MFEHLWTKLHVIFFEFLYIEKYIEEFCVFSYEQLEYLGFRKTTGK